MGVYFLFYYLVSLENINFVVFNNHPIVIYVSNLALMHATKISEAYKMKRKKEYEKRWKISVGWNPSEHGWTKLNNDGSVLGNSGPTEG